MAVLKWCSWAAAVAVNAALASATLAAYEVDFQTPAIVEGPPGQIVQFAAVVRITDADQPVQGWQVCVVTTDPAACSIVDATTSGTVGADVSDDPPGMRDEGYELTELTTGPGNEGAISAVALSAVHPIALDPGGTPYDLLRLTVEVTVPTDCQLTTYALRFLDGLQGSGSLPLDNIVVAQGLSHTPIMRERTVVVRSADSDGDGIHDGCDACPDTPSCAPVHADGCPTDTDGDGVYDGCEPDAQQGCCGTAGPVAPLGLAVGMLLLGRLRTRTIRTRRK